MFARLSGSSDSSVTIFTSALTLRSPGRARSNIMEPTQEQSNYHFNGLQHMKDNAELCSILGLAIESESRPKSPPPVNTTNKSSYEDEPQQHEPFKQIANPFSISAVEAFLSHVNFPGSHRRGYQQINGVPKLALKKDACYVGNDRFLVKKILGKGSYGNVYKAIRCDTSEVVALKIQRPPNKWEFYICREIQARLADHPLRECFMDIHVAYFSEQASVLLSDVHSGSLLDLINLIKVKLRNGSKHNLSIYLTCEMMKIVQALHRIKIIHADIKPDNFLVMTANDSVQLQLIDFGCSIDMSLMPQDTTFTCKLKTLSFQCCEMLDDRPWSYHTDLFCIAATAHVLLLENYMKMQKTGDRWSITKKIPRYYREDLWGMFFNCMLNMQEALPDLDYLISFFADSLDPKELRTATTFIISAFRNR